MWMRCPADRASGGEDDMTKQAVHVASRAHCGSLPPSQMAADGEHARSAQPPSAAEGAAHVLELVRVTQSAVALAAPSPSTPSPTGRAGLTSPNPAADQSDWAPPPIPPPFPPPSLGVQEDSSSNLNLSFASPCSDQSETVTEAALILKSPMHKSPRSPYRRSLRASVSSRALASGRPRRSTGFRCGGAASASAAEDSGFGARLGDGLDGCGYAAGDSRVDALQTQMREDTLYRPDYPAEGERVTVFDWAAELPAAFAEEFSAEDRSVLGQAYNPRAPRVLCFYSEDIVQGPDERLACGGCAPRTPLRHCGEHGTAQLTLCAEATACLHAGGTRGAATCLFDNFARVGGRVAAAMQRRPVTPETELGDTVLAALAAAAPNDVAEGVAAAYVYSYEIKVPPGTQEHVFKSRPTQIYRMLGCAMRSLGDPGSRERLSSPQLLLWQMVVELFRPFQWRLDQFLLMLPHQPRVVYRGIDLRVADSYSMDSIVLWPPVTSTSLSREVAWSFMSATGAGTFWIILAESVAEISRFSWLPGEDEWLLHTLSVHKVTNKLHPGLRALLRTNHDLVCLVQVDGRGGQQLSAREIVNARALAWTEATRLFDDFFATYVQPLVRVGTTSQGTLGAEEDPLLEVLQEWSGSDRRTAVLLGEGGSGKTAAALRILRAAADNANPLPRPAGQAQSFVPLYVPLPAVRNLFVPDGAGPAQRGGLADYLVQSAHLGSEGAAELRKRPLLLVLDGLEEVPEDLEWLCGRGLLAAAGLGLEEWEQARVVVCIRPELLQRSRGSCCSRWRLTPADILPDAALWHLQPFAESQVETFCKAVVQKELQGLAAAAPAVESEEKLESALTAVRCAPPPLEKLRALHEEARSLRQTGASGTAAASAAAKSPAGAECGAAMLCTTADAVGRIREADSSLVTCPFTLSMIVAVGRSLSDADMSAGPRPVLYRAWAEAEVRHRLPRVASLSERSPQFAEMDTDARVALVMDFCSRLACCSQMIKVHSSLGAEAHLSRFAQVSGVVSLELSPLGPEHNEVLLQAAPLRVEEGEGAKLSFVHASIHDYFIARRAAALYEESGMSQLDVQVVCFALPRAPSLQTMLKDVAGKEVLRKMWVKRYKLRATLIVVIIMLNLSFGNPTSVAGRTGQAIFQLAVTSAWLPRRTHAHPGLPLMKRIQWQRVLLVFSAVGAAAVWILQTLGCRGGVHNDVNAVCTWWPIGSIIWFVFFNLQVIFLAMEPQLLVAAAFRVPAWRWPSVRYRLLTRMSLGCLVSYHAVATIFWHPDVQLWNLIFALIDAWVLYRTRHVGGPPDARASAA
eukprot:TRINITY_DN7394_c0_g1_i1.p1 TRINITY_DN7394_c0_g1~~TRINITY_DN7394_c0_g1_i1.p1  ORF type:complete len:1310 (+),score=225.10 TRINITY_DN7394_c0_g1_i1:1593-5522(+)